MVNRPGTAYFLAVVFLILLMGISLGCNETTEEPGPVNGQEPASAEDQQQDEGVQEATDENPGDQPSQQVEIPDEVLTMIGDSGKVSQEEAEAITNYGTFIFPESAIDRAQSDKFSHSDGTEIFNLTFRAGTGVRAVADWYSDNLEAGTEINVNPVAGGILLAHFEYESQAGDWNKRITVTGIPGENHCLIKVLLTRLVSHDEENEEHE